MDFALILTKLIDGIPFNALERDAAESLGKEVHAIIEHHRQAQEQPPADPSPSAGSGSGAPGGSEPAGTSPGV